MNPESAAMRAFCFTPGIVPLAEVVVADPAYLRWLLGSDARQRLDPLLVSAIREVLQ